MTAASVGKRLRWSGLSIAAGLIVQIWTLRGEHPLAFVAFLTIACPLTGGGILIFLRTIVAAKPTAEDAAGTRPEPR